VEDGCCGGSCNCAENNETVQNYSGEPIIQTAPKTEYLYSGNNSTTYTTSSNVEAKYIYGWEWGVADLSSEIIEKPQEKKMSFWRKILSMFSRRP
jgi:hypothetical protein